MRSGILNMNNVTKIYNHEKEWYFVILMLLAVTLLDPLCQ